MIDVIKLIKREKRKRNTTIADLAHKLKLHKSSVHGMFKRKSLKVQRLAEFCNIFEYNFFREIAEQIPFKNPAYDDKQKKMEHELREEIKILKFKIEVMESMIEKIGGLQYRNR